MFRGCLVAAAAILTLTIAGPAAAQSSRAAPVPAEFPPASFKGLQYVDSKGCVFIRAGIDGNVTWVPRLTRQRKQICGAQPTQVAGTAIAPPPPPRVEQITLPTQPEATAAQPTRVARTVPRLTPKPSPLRSPAAATARASTPATSATRPKPVVLTAPKPRTAAAAPVVIATAPQPPATRQPTVLRGARVSACPNASAAAQPYINSGELYPVRCGPQADDSFAAPLNRRSTGNTVVAALGPVPSTSLPGSTRVLPKHLAEDPSRGVQTAIPSGYRAAWDDDRLNPRRAEGTLAGRDAMNLVWTTTVPRRLIDRTTGKDVTAKIALVYPYTDFAAQRRSLGEVTLATRNGQTVKRIVRNKAQPKATLATRSAAPKQKTAASAPKAERLAGKRYVQVGTFGVSRNAQATAARMKQLGLPVRIGKYTRSGKIYRIVLAGPYASSDSANAALRTVRGAGFGDAFLRK